MRIGYLVLAICGGGLLQSEPVRSGSTVCICGSFAGSYNVFRARDFRIGHDDSIVNAIRLEALHPGWHSALAATNHRES